MSSIDWWLATITPPLSCAKCSPPRSSHVIPMTFVTCFRINEVYLQQGILFIAAESGCRTSLQTHYFSAKHLRIQFVPHWKHYFSATHLRIQFVPHWKHYFSATHLRIQFLPHWKHYFSATHLRIQFVPHWKHYFSDTLLRIQFVPH
jgi:hypothetical protein